MPLLDGKHILVGVGGSIAAYRACDVVRRLRELGATVRVAPTKAASAFVTPLTFEALSGAPCLGNVLDVERGAIPHIEEAYRTNAAVIVPATADLLAKMAHGFADEALLATLLSLRAPLVVAPAMETRMWEHSATQLNARTLRERGAHFVGPVAGALASGRSGSGRLASVDDVVEAVVAALAPKDLVGKRIVITAGPTVEDIDPVRSITNRSSGKMGIALARNAAMRGAHVELVHGPLKIAAPSTPGITAHAVRSAREMFEATMNVVDGADVAILAAAVADARPKSAATKKLKKTKGELQRIELEPTDDILATLGERRAQAASTAPLLVGFAAETGNVAKYARDKLVRKKIDLVCANDVAEAGSGFDVDTNRILLVKKSGRDRWLERASKDETAARILDEVRDLLLHPATARAPKRTKASGHTSATKSVKTDATKNAKTRSRVGARRGKTR